jgi:hypothetical protein
MEQSDTNENAAIEPIEASEVSPIVASARSVAGQVAAQSGVPGCPTCGAIGVAPSGGTASNYVYALGQIEERYPRPSVEKEVAQATGRGRPLAGQTGKPFIRSCRDGRTAISRGNCAGC